MLTSSENLVNCWIREGGQTQFQKEGLLLIPMSSHGDAPLEVRFDRRTLLGDVRLSDPVRQAGKDLDPLTLAELLVGEIKRKPGSFDRLVSDWKENLKDSIRISEKISEARTPERETETTFLASEQGLVHGHRFHPSPKSRIGFSEQDHQDFSPEWGAHFKLRYLGIHKDNVIVRGDKNSLEEWKNKSSQWISGNSNYSLHEFISLPLHPWQAQLILKNEEIQKALADGSILDLGIQGPIFYPTASVRTLYQPDWDLFIKTSLDVRITNCFRPNLSKELEALEHVRQALKEFPADRFGFRVMDEPLSIDLHPRFPVHAGSIFRGGISQETSLQVEPILAAWLFGDRENSAARISRIIGPNQDPILWFREYCEALIPPLLEAFLRNGIMFEPHLQNILVGIKEGRVQKILLRDLNNLEVVEGSPAFKALKHLPAGELSYISYSEDFAWKRLIYCLIVNHLSEAIASLAESSTQDKNQFIDIEKELWIVLREVLLSCGPHERIQKLVNENELWAKMNFFTRVTRTSDREAPFSAIPNPLTLGVSSMKDSA